MSVVFADVFAPASCVGLFSTDLVAEMKHEIEYRIEGLTANDSTKKIFSTRGTDMDPWTRSATVWITEGDTPLALTGASPWNSNSSFTKAGVLISPRHIVFANHFPITNGSTIIFIADDNTIVTRTLQAQVEIVFQPNQDDIQLGVLNADVPAGIAFYPIVSKEEVERYFSEPIVPFILFDQEQKASIVDLDYSYSSMDGHASLSFFTPPATTTRYAFSEALVGGDSGQPGFFVIDGQPTLTTTITGDGYGPFYGAYTEALNEAILDLGNDGGYQISTYDLSCFVGNETPVVTPDTLTLSENSPINTVVGTVTATDAYGGNTLTYTIVSGNTDSAFTIDGATGVLTVQTASVIDFETNPSFDLVVGATDNWMTPRTGTGTTHIDLEDVLEVVVPTVTTDAVSSIEQTTAVGNGTISTTGGENVTARGFTFGLTTAYGATTTENGVFSTGVFSGSLTSLVCETLYHVKVWASNPTAGIAYGADRSFTTSTCSVEEEESGGGGDNKKPIIPAVPEAVPQNDTKILQTLLIQLKSLIVQFIALGGIPTPEMVVFLGPISEKNEYSRDLTLGDSGQDVVKLQIFLITQNSGSFARTLFLVGATGYFGTRTQQALAEFQMVKGVTPSIGYFGQKTRAVVLGLSRTVAF
ncbi:MAG: cadherin domain-containing protein [Candidatus Campbellbacteria bacterium]|nr:cadherin domain-containing protein [Candidatus Campbellbacteria bacterium]